MSIKENICVVLKEGLKVEKCQNTSVHIFSIICGLCPSLKIIFVKHGLRKVYNFCKKLSNLLRLVK